MSASLRSPDTGRSARSLVATATPWVAAAAVWVTAGAGFAQDGPASEPGAEAAAVLEAAEAVDDSGGRVERSAGIEEIRVEAQIPTGVTQDDSISAVAFNQDTLLADGISDIRDLSNYTPNLEIKTAFAASNPTLFIRGVGLDDYNANSASAVSVYQDGVYMNSPAGMLFGLYDVESVEVLRGPQPTLTNASAGAILVRSRQPTDEFEAYLTTTLAEYNEKAFQGALNVPILPGWISMRTAFNFHQRDGITRNLCAADIEKRNLTPTDACYQASGQSAAGFAIGPNQPTTGDVNDIDRWAARGLIAAKMPLPGEQQEVDWLLNVGGGKNNGLAAQFQHRGVDRTAEASANNQLEPLDIIDAFGNRSRDNGRPRYRQERTNDDFYEGEYDRIGPERLRLFGASLKGTWSPIDALEFESLSAYFWHDRETYANDDGNPVISANNDYLDTAWQFNQEAKLRWLFGEESEATLGGSYLREDLEIANVSREDRGAIERGNGPEFPFPAFSQDATQDTSQWGVYATTHLQLPGLPSWGEFVSNFSIDGSVRYNHVTKDFSNVATALVRVVQAGTRDPLVAPFDGEETWSAWAWDASLTYHFTEDKNIYAKLSRGWKPGHFNAATPIQTGRVNAVVEPETVDAIEVGLRTLWWDGRIKANLTAFWYDYEDLQVFQRATDSSGLLYNRLINAEEAEIWGIEGEISLAPVEGLNLTFNWAYLDSEYTKFSTIFDRSSFVPGRQPPRQVENVEVDYSGNRLIASPVWSWNGSVEYTIPLSRFGSLRPRFSYAFKDKVFFDANEGFGAEDNLERELLSQESYWVLNANLTYTSPGGRFEVSGFVRNMLDEHYRVQSFDVSSSTGRLVDAYADPRTAGAIITVWF